MIRLLKYVMKIFYANENFAKYRMSGGNYFMALIGATFYILVTLFTLLFIFFAIFPDFYKWYLAADVKINSKLFAAILIGFIFVFLRFFVKEDQLKDPSLTKEVVTKAVNYLIAYLFFALIVIGFIGLKFLRHYKS